MKLEVKGVNTGNCATCDSFMRTGRSCSKGEDTKGAACCKHSGLSIDATCGNCDWRLDKQCHGSTPERRTDTSLMRADWPDTHRTDFCAKHSLLTGGRVCQSQA